MIYIYSKSLEVTGALHPLSSEWEKEQYNKQQLGGMLEPDKFMWCQIKPFMLSRAWYSNDGCARTLETNNKRNGFELMPTGVGYFPAENRLFWHIQATKQLLRYLDYRKSNDANRMQMAKERFKLALQYRRGQRGLITTERCPSFFNHPVKTIMEILDKIEALRSTRHKNMRLIETCVKEYLNAVTTTMQHKHFIDPSVNEALTMLRVELYENTAFFYQEPESELITCQHDNESLHLLLASLAGASALRHLDRIERIVPNFRKGIEEQVNEAIQKTIRSK
ncbi:hypothetical protein [Vibrio sp. TRT 29B02]|uniref:hypothetical protein n=1 Tax=Vibrio sp. TRT 29B02 TaxID=3418508 RepID=UPI003CF03289